MASAKSANVPSASKSLQFFRLCLWPISWDTSIPRRKSSVVVLDENAPSLQAKNHGCASSRSADKLSRKHHGIAARRHEPSNDKSDTYSAQSQSYVSYCRIARRTGTELGHWGFECNGEVSPGTAFWVKCLTNDSVGSLENAGRYCCSPSDKGWRKASRTSRQGTWPS